MTQNEKHSDEQVLIAQSIQQAASAWGYSIDYLKQCKAAGCPAFRGSRIYFNGLKKWLKINGDKVSENDSKHDLEKKKLALQCRQIEHNIEIQQGKYRPIEEIREVMILVGERLRTLFRQKLEVEYPPLVAGLDVSEVRKKGMQMTDELCRILTDESSAWMKH
jgi:hypothetical protein